MKILRVDVGERPEIEIPLVSVVSLEIEMGVLVLVGLLHHGIFKVVTLAQGAVAVVIVVHPLIYGRGLLADGFQRRVRVEKSERGRQPVIGNAVHANVPVVVRDVFHEPVDRIVGIGGLVGGLGIAEVDPGGKIERALRFKASAKILDDEDVAVLGQLLYGGRHLLRRLLGDAVGSASKQNGQRAGLIDWSEDNGLEANAVAHGNHDFLKLEDRLRRRHWLRRSLLRCSRDGKQK